MAIFFSRSRWTFFNSSIHADIPNDKVEISEEYHRDLRDKMASGMELDCDANGFPYARPKEAPSPAALTQSMYQRKTEEINNQCGELITNGFMSTALGAMHIYSSQLDDQLNLTGAILRGLDMPYACRDAQGVKAFRLHTAAQLRQVGDDFTLYKLQLLQHANELKQQLDHALATGDTEAMALIRWEAAQP